MTTRKPMVMGDDGFPQVLQAGDQLAADTALADVRTVANDETATPLAIATPVYVSSGGKVKRAVATAKTTAKVFGLVYDPSIAVGGSGKVATDGFVTATTAQWDGVTGQSGGLTPGANYFLDPITPGRLTVTPPATTGQVNVFVGQALTATDFEVSIALPILL